MVETFDHLAHQILLLAINPRTGELRSERRLWVVTAAAVLAELVLQERVRLRAGKVEVRDSRPFEDPVLDVMLSDLASRPARSPIRITADPRETYLNQTLAELVANGWVRLTPKYGISKAQYVVLDAERLNGAKVVAAHGLRDPAGASDREAYLAGFASQLGLTRELASELPFGQRLRVKRLLTERSWVNEAVGEVFKLTVQLDRI